MFELKHSVIIWKPIKVILVIYTVELVKKNRFITILQHLTASTPQYESVLH